MSQQTGSEKGSEYIGFIWFIQWRTHGCVGSSVAHFDTSYFTVFSFLESSCLSLHILFQVSSDTSDTILLQPHASEEVEHSIQVIFDKAFAL